MKVKDFSTLRRVLSREIIPLLQEYFYEDWQRIRRVLADNAVPADHQIVKRESAANLFFGTDDDDHAESAHYVVIPELDITPDAVRKIYEPQE